MNNKKIKKKVKTEEYAEYGKFSQRGNIFYRNRYAILAFVLTACIMLVSYIARRIYPFGDQIILKVDLYHQYAPFHEELRHRILNGQSLMYSWEGGLGKEFFVQAAYYTASPISIFILLFTQGALPEALGIFILVKIAFCGGFFAYYLRKRFGKNDITITLFGLFYAFTAYLTGYYWNVMWLDAVALFPVVALGVDSLVRDGKIKLYTLSLALVIVINFYIAFIVCIFAALYFLVTLFSVYGFKRDLNTMINRVIKFAVCSLLGGGISMFLTIPTVIALSHTETSNTGFPSFEVYKNVYQLITNHFAGARPVVLARNEDLPNVYSGIPAMLLFPLYFANKNFNTKEKIGYALLLVMMLLCACIKPLDYLIHGAHFPSNLPHRYTFIYSFIMLIIAYKAFIHLKDEETIIMNFAFVFYTVVILLTEFIIVKNVSDIDRVLSTSDIIINVVGMLVYIVLLNVIKGIKPEDLKPALTVFLALTIAESIFSSYEGLDTTTGRDAYTKYIPATKQAVAMLDQKENGEFYRTEFRRFTTINDAALYHYNGFSQFSSMSPGGISNFIGALGIAATGNSFRYYDPTSLVDALFDVKYVMNKADDNGNGEIENERYTFLDKFTGERGIGDVWVYENDRVLPLGFMTDEKIKDWQINDSTPFDVQNQFVNEAAGVEGKMFTDIPVGDINKTYMKVTDQINDNEFKYELTDPANLSLEPTVSATIVSDKDQYIFMYVDAGNAKRVKYDKVGDSQDRELSAGKSLFDIGRVAKGEKVNVNFALTNKGEFEKTYRKDGTVKIYFASYDDSVFQKAYDKLSQQTYDITKFEDTHIEGTIDAGEGGVMFTSIPYVGGWSVKVDGKKTDKVSIGEDGVIGVDLEKGTHEVVFDFTPQGVVPGLVISVISVGLFILYIRFSDKDKKAKKPEQQAEIAA